MVNLQISIFCINLKQSKAETPNKFVVKLTKKLLRLESNICFTYMYLMLIS